MALLHALVGQCWHDAEPPVYLTWPSYKKITHDTYHVSTYRFAAVTRRLTANGDALASGHLRPDLVLDRLHRVPPLALVALQDLHVVGQRRLCCTAGAPVALGQEKVRLLSGAPLGRKDLIMVWTNEGAMGTNQVRVNFIRSIRYDTAVQNNWGICSERDGTTCACAC